MIKHLFICLAMSTALLASADNLTTMSTTATPVNEEKAKEILKQLEQIEGYIFLEKGDDKSRKLTDTFGRTDKVFKGKDEVALADMEWEVLNTDIASIELNDGEIKGNKYGQTILKVTDGDEEHYFIVCVCPTISIVSPEGVIYTHQKVYNSKTKVDFTQSDHFTINSVMAKYDTNDNGQFDVYDITDNIDKETGHYESDLTITSDVFYTVTLEEDTDDNILSQSPFRILVNDGLIYIKAAKDEYADKVTEGYLKNMTVVGSTPKNRKTLEHPDIYEAEVYRKKASECLVFDGEMPRYNIGFNNGVYFFTLIDNNDNGKEYKYKIVINK